MEDVICLLGACGLHNGLTTCFLQQCQEIGKDTYMYVVHIHKYISFINLIINMFLYVIYAVRFMEMLFFAI